MPGHQKTILQVVSAILDLVLLALVVIWMIGGLDWHGRQILRHGADLRRTALLLGAFAAWSWPALRTQSLWLKASVWVWSWLQNPRPRWLALGIGFGVASTVGILQALALRVPLWDVGLFHQIIWSVAHGHGFVSTISGAGNFLLDHLSPALALLAPAFWLSGGSPLTLQVLHPLLIYVGVAAWVWFASLQAAELAAATVLFGLGFESFWGNLHWGFHENAPAFAALSWAFALIFADKTRGVMGKLGVLALFLVAAASKEILLVDVALALLVWAWVERRKGVLFPAKLVLIAFMLLGAFVWFEKLPHPVDKNYFDRYYAYLGHDLGTFLRTALLTPWVIVSAVGAKELGRYFLTVFLPWLFLPLYAMVRAPKQALWLLALLPSLASAALATYPPLRGANFHYVLELWPVLAILTIAMLARLQSSKFIVGWALLALLCWDRDPIGDVREYWVGMGEQNQVRQALAAIPEEASVSADELAGPWVAGRTKVTRWPELKAIGGTCPDWIAVRGEAARGQAIAQCAGPRLRSMQHQGEWTLLGFGQ